jgi:hypothetical protein
MRPGQRATARIVQPIGLVLEGDCGDIFLSNVVRTRRQVSPSLMPCP